MAQKQFKLLLYEPSEFLPGYSIFPIVACVETGIIGEHSWLATKQIYNEVRFHCYKPIQCITTLPIMFPV